jgi:hypothetical protein
MPRRAFRYVAAAAAAGLVLTTVGCGKASPTSTAGNQPAAAAATTPAGPKTPPKPCTVLTVAIAAALVPGAPKITDTVTDCDYKTDKLNWVDVSIDTTDATNRFQTDSDSYKTTAAPLPSYGEQAFIDVEDSGPEVASYGALYRVEFVKGTVFVVVATNNTSKIDAKQRVLDMAKSILDQL